MGNVQGTTGIKLAELTSKELKFDQDGDMKISSAANPLQGASALFVWYQRLEVDTVGVAVKLGSERDDPATHALGT